MGNTERDILRILSTLRGLSCAAIALRKWPKTKQIDKKERTIRQYIRASAKKGHVKLDGDLVSITSAGKAALNGEVARLRRFESIPNAPKSPEDIKRLVAETEKGFARWRRQKEGADPAEFKGFPRIAE